MTQDIYQLPLMSFEVVQFGASHQQSTVPEKVLMEIGVGKGDAVGYQQQVSPFEEGCSGRYQRKLHWPVTQGGRLVYGLSRGRFSCSLCFKLGDTSGSTTARKLLSVMPC